MISVREVRLDDSTEIFNLRNNALTREMSHSPDKIEWDDHCKWFECALKNPYRILLICEDKLKNKIAVVRFDLCKDVATVSINMSPSQRGKGNSRPCLISSIEFMASKVHSITSLLAEIKVINLASQKLFIGAGFQLYKEESGVGFYKKIIRSNLQNN